MHPEVFLFLIAAALPAVLILPWRVRYRMRWGWGRLVLAVLFSWPVVTTVAVRQINRDVSAYYSQRQFTSDGYIRDDQLLYDGVGDRLFFLMFGGWFLPLILGLPMLLVRYLIDLAMYRDTAWSNAEREWQDFSEHLKSAVGAPSRDI